MNIWAKGMLRLLSIRLQVQGHPPAPPFLLAANHLSYLDIVVLSALAPQGFVAKSEMATWPILGPMAKGMGTLFLDRGNPRDTLRVSRELNTLWQMGTSACVFLEGTSSNGDCILPFHSALLENSARHSRPVVAAHLRYTSPDADVRNVICWHGEQAFLPHLFHLFTLPRIEAQIRLDSRPTLASDRRQLAATLWKRVEGFRQQAIPVQAARGQAVCEQTVAKHTAAEKAIEEKPVLNAELASS